jgi:hypothetical protein
MSEEPITVTVKVSGELLKNIRLADPTLKSVPATYIVDMNLRDKLEQLKKKAK